MPSIDIHIEYETDIPPHHTVWADWVVFACISLYTLYSLSLVMLIMYFRNRFVMKHSYPYMLILMCLGSVIQIWATFVSNAHLHSYTWFHRVMTVHCPLFDYWLVYVLGFFAWYWGMMSRMLRWVVIHYGLVSYKRYFVRYSFLLFMLLCIVSLCVALEITQGSYVSHSQKWCVSHWYYKSILITWILTCCVFLWLTLIALYKFYKNMGNAITYRETLISALTWTLFFVPLLALNLMGFIVFWWGRCVFTLLMCIMHFLSITIIIRVPLSSIYNGIHDMYQKNMFTSQLMSKSSVMHLYVESAIQELKIQFLDHVTDLPPQKADHPGAMFDREVMKFNTQFNKTTENDIQETVNAAMWTLLPHCKSIPKKNHNFVYNYNACNVVILFFDCISIRQSENNKKGASWPIFFKMLQTHFRLHDENQQQINQLLWKSNEPSKDNAYNIITPPHFLTETEFCNKFTIIIDDNIRGAHSVAIDTITLRELYQNLCTGEINVKLIYYLFAIAGSVIERFWYDDFIQKGNNSQILQKAVLKSHAPYKAAVAENIIDDADPTDTVIEINLIDAYDEKMTDEEMDIPPLE